MFHLTRMTHGAFTAVVLILAHPVGAGTSGPLASDPEVARRLLDIVEAGSRIQDTEHFTVAYDTSSETLRPLLVRLESTYDAVWRFCEKIGPPARVPDERMGVILFDGYGDYLRYCDRIGFKGGGTAGFYSPGTNTAVFANTLTRPELREVAEEIERTEERLRHLQGPGRGFAGRRAQHKVLSRRLGSLRGRRDALVDRFNRFVLDHEIAHQIFFNRGVHVRGADNPTWLVEGLACQFEVAQDGIDGRLLRINPFRLGDLREALGVSPGDHEISDETYRAALASNRCLPLHRLIGEREVFTRDPQLLAYRYAEAWGLVYYLCRTQRDKLPIFVHRVSRRQPAQVVGPEEEWRDFEAVFGPIDEDFRRQWLSYMLELRVEPDEAGG